MVQLTVLDCSRKKNPVSVFETESMYIFGLKLFSDWNRDRRPIDWSVFWLSKPKNEPKNTEKQNAQLLSSVSVLVLRPTYNSAVRVGYSLKNVGDGKFTSIRTRCWSQKLRPSIFRLQSMLKVAIYLLCLWKKKAGYHHLVACIQPSDWPMQ